jgi:hypothetical protein
MFKIERKFIRGEKFGPCEGYYVYKIHARDGLPSEWLSFEEYSKWKRSIIDENFPTSEA